MSSGRKRLLLLALIGVFVLVGAGAASAVDSFDDVDADHRFHDEIMALAGAGVVDGFPDGTFRPDAEILRQQVAKIIVLATGVHTEAVDNESNPTFNDVSPGMGVPYPFDYVEEAAKEGYFKGDEDNNFNPGANISRVQLALVVVRAGDSALEEPPADYDPGFTDVSTLGAEAQAAVAKAKYNGILSGKSDTIFDPWSPATRGHVAKMVDHVRDKIAASAPGAVSGVSTAAAPEYEAMAAHLNAVVTLGYNTIGTDAVAKLLFDDDPANDPFILDTREPEDFADGHIPGAVNIPLPDLPEALMTGSPAIPADKDIVVASYWGDDGDFAMILLNAARIADPAAQKAAEDAKEPTPYPVARVLFQGMTSWSFDRELVPAGTRFDDALAAGITVDGKPTEAGAVTPEDPGAYPAFKDFGTSDVIEQILVRAKNYLNSVPKQTDLHIFPAELAALLEDGDAGNDPQIVSVRQPAHFELGHIPGAINIPWTKAADIANFTKFVDPTSDLVVYCYTGHTGGVGTMIFGILGYENARNLLYGMNGWSTSAPASGQLKSFDLMRAWDFPVNDGGADDLDSLAEYTRPSGCEGCHTELTGIFVDREVKDPPPAQAAAPSSGEG
ncbi:MAG: hypothetical protein Kow00129_15300 [Thermoleophilia bacterium]